MLKGKDKKRYLYISKRTLFMIALILVIGLTVGVAAKYIYDNGGRNIFSAKEFYFTSNLLTEDTGKYILNSTSDKISFTIGNHADKLRFSQEDIAYTVSVTCETLTSEDPAPVLDSQIGKLEKGRVSTDTITLSNLIPGKTYRVTAIGTAGYLQTLRAEFTVSDKEENVYKHIDTSNSAYVLLTVWTQNVSGDLRIAVNAEGLIPDNTDPVLQEVYNYSGGVYQEIPDNDEEGIKDQISFQESYSSRTYRFFIDKTDEINIEQFTVYILKNGVKYRAEKGILE